MSIEGGTITKQALGRHAFLGSLYDVRCDRFEGGSLFNQALPTTMISTDDSADSGYIIDENISQKDTFQKLNVDGSLKLSLMAGLTKVEASAKYLTQTKADSRTVRVTFMLQIKTKKDSLLISMADLHQYFSENALENENATHCVIGITWGARTAATFEQIFSSSEEANDIQGSLAGQLNKIAYSVTGDAKVERNQRENSKFDSLKISFSGDIKVEEVVRTVEGVFNIFKQVPALLKDLNHGKGRPLEYELYPLKEMAKIFHYEIRISRMIRAVTNSLVNRIENIFEQILQGKRLINNYWLTIEPWTAWIPSEWTMKIYDKRNELIDVELKTQRKLGQLLEQIRRNEAEEDKMVQLLDDFETKSPCSVKSIEAFRQSNASIMTKIGCLREFDQRKLDGSPVETPPAPNASVLSTKFSSIEAFVQESYDNHIYLLHISNAWLKDPKNWNRQLRCFKRLYKLEQISETQTNLFRVIDHDLHRDLDHIPTTSVIYHAHHGLIETEDYYQTSLTKLSLQQMRLLREENKFTTLTIKDIERLSREFLIAHPSGELNQSQLIEDFQKLYPKGDSRHFCDLAIPIIDQDRNGLISFVEYMSALSLVYPCEMESKVSLIAAICSENGEKITEQTLVQYLEATIQLEREKSAADLNKMRLLAKEILKSTVRKNEQFMTREEFIDCLKGNYDWCLTFLPPLTTSSSFETSDQDHEISSKKACKFGSVCYSIKNPEHCQEYSHLNDANLHPKLCGWASDCKDRRKEHLASFSHSSIGNRKPCRYGVNCLIQFSKGKAEHNARYAHPCRFAEDCRNTEGHLTHEPRNAKQCKYDGSCEKLNDPLHRSKYRHAGMPYYLIPCRDQTNCKEKSKEHRIKFSHGEKVWEATATSHNYPGHLPKPCTWGDKCTNTTTDHRKRFSHPPE